MPIAAHRTPPPRTPVVPRLADGAFVFWCEDGPDAAAMRLRHLDGHLAHIEAHHDRYLVAGPLRTDGAAALSGSLFVVAAPSLADAEALMAGDPYMANGVYARVEIRAFVPAAGRWMGGVIWRSADELRPLADGGAPA